MIIYWGYVYYMALNLLSVVIILVLVLVGVAFLTMMERKILSYIQYRKGPNKVGMLGIFQPFSDALKLLSKEMLIVFKSNIYIYYMSPMVMMGLMFMCWQMVPWVTNFYYMNYSMLVTFVLMSLGGYMLLLVGWSSNSSYSMLGSIRLVAQVISYEVSFILIMLTVMFLSESYSFSGLLKWQFYLWNIYYFFPVFSVFYLSMMAELNRSPVDLIEGESELVSGFNVEYFSGAFALIFLGEYGMIMFMCFILLIMFTGLLVVCWSFWFVYILVLFSVIFFRGILPRVRYDVLMYVCWKIVLPLSLNYLIFLGSFKFFCGVSM